MELNENPMGKGQAGRMHNHPSHWRGLLNQQKRSWQKEEKVVQKASDITYFDQLIAKQKHNSKFTYLCN